MPFVRIDALRADQAKLDGLGRAVHEALVDAIAIPADGPSFGIAPAGTWTCTSRSNTRSSAMPSTSACERA